MGYLIVVEERGREGTRTERMRERLISIKEGPENYTSPLDCKEHRERGEIERGCVRLMLMVIGRK